MSFKLQQSFTDVTDNLIFKSNNSFEQALKDGFFLVKAPKGLDLSSGDLFAENFYKDKTNDGSDADMYRGFSQYTPDKFVFPHEGYYLREEDQTEQFFLEKRFWKDIYPTKLNVLANELNQFALTILRNVLSYINIPEDLWPVATGNCIYNNGTHHLTFNHFRPEKQARGLNVHKDSGWITILRSHEPGLEACINNRWEQIDPKEGYFIVNFGCAMEILTIELEKPISAIIHRVNQTIKKSSEPDRYSYALFTDSSLDEGASKGLYAFHREHGLSLKMDFNIFLNEILKDTYDKDTVGLY